MPDPAIYRTYDTRLRQARHDLLAASARAAAKVAEGSGYDVLVTGSVSRGETHPWSDLDILLRRTGDCEEDAWNLQADIADACSRAGLDTVEVVDERHVYEALRPGLLGSAIPVTDIPALAALPEPGLVIGRCAMSLRICLSQVRKDIDSFRNLPEDTQPRLERIYANSTWVFARRLLEDKANLTLKRLAVFQDGGRSGYLDGGTNDDVRELLGRLSQPATDPFDRPPVIPPNAIEPLVWLLDMDTELDRTGQEAGVERCLAALEDCIKHLDGLGS